MIIMYSSSSFIISMMICFFGLFHHLLLLLLLLGPPVVVMAERHKHTPNLVELSSRKELVEMAGYGEDKLSSVLISGTLLCSPHKPPTDPLPVAGALVGVSCHTHTHSSVEKSNWASGITDELGDFLIDLPSHLHAIPNLHHKCMLRVLRLPRNSLCRPTFAAKKTALKLSSFGNGIRTYTAQTPSLYLTPKAASRRNKCTHQLGRRADSGCPVQSYQH